MLPMPPVSEWAMRRALDILLACVGGIIMGPVRGENLGDLASSCCCESCSYMDLLGTVARKPLRYSLTLLT